MRVAFSYIRFSSKKQASGDSLRRQTEKAAAWCARNNVPLADLNYHDVMSAFRGKNVQVGALSLFLEAVENGRVPKDSYLIVENLDRLSRASFWQATAVVRQILESGISIVTLNPEVELTTESDDHQIMFLVMDLMRSHRESAVKSDRLKSKWEKRRKDAREQKKAVGGKLPAWIDLVDGKYCLNAKAETVKLIFKLAAEGSGLKRIQRYLTENKVEAIGTGRKGKEPSWNTSYLGNLLRSRSVLGEKQFYIMKGTERIPDGDPIEGYFPAAIKDLNLFHKAQETIRNNSSEGAGRFRGRGQKKILNLFSSMVYDARDGGSIVFHRGKSGGRTDWVSLVSYNSLRKKGSVPRIHFPLQAFEDAVLLSIKELTKWDFFPCENAVASSELEKKRGELAELKHKEERLHERAMTHGESVDAVLPLLEKVKAKRRELEKEVESLQGQVVVNTESSLEDLHDLIDAMNTSKNVLEVRERLQSKLRLMIEKIAVLFSLHKRDGEKRSGYQYVRKAVIEVYFRSGLVRQIHVWADGGKGVYTPELDLARTSRLTNLPTEFHRNDPACTLVLVDPATQRILI
jgi:DNA invertase Pin-like site-specific DNA recombinase